MLGRRNVVVGTAGHIDHGKTSLVFALTGKNTDRLPAERQRGITIDLGFAVLDLDPFVISLIDVPGHERFIRNMVAGAAGIDLALLVVAADDSVMPQTREHLQILSFLNVKRGLIALTKVDLVNDDWRILVQDEIRELVAGTFLAQAPIIPVSVQTGEGLPELRQELRMACESLPIRSDTELFRMPVDRSFTIAGHGTVVTGTISSGKISIGDELECWPSGRTVRVRGLHRHDRSSECLGRGTRAAVNLAGIHHTEIARGHELAAIGYLEPSLRLILDIQVSTDAPRPLKHRRSYIMHLGTQEISGQLLLQEGVELSPGQRSVAQIVLREPVVSVALEAFVLREASPAATVAGGQVLDTNSARSKRAWYLDCDRLVFLSSQDAEARLVGCLGRLPLRAWQKEALVRESGLPFSKIDEVLTRMIAVGTLVEIPYVTQRPVLTTQHAVDQLMDGVVRVTRRLHAARPRQSALRRVEVISALGSLGPDWLVHSLLERLATLGKVVATSRTVALKDHQPKLTQAEKTLKNGLLDSVRKGGFRPPSLAELSTAAGARSGVVPELLALLAEEGHLVEIGSGVWLESDLEALLRQRVQERLALPGEQGFSMSELRDMFDTTRKYAVPFGEYLDRIGLTQREGDLRVRVHASNPAQLDKACEGMGP